MKRQTYTTNSKNLPRPLRPTTYLTLRYINICIKIITHYYKIYKLLFLSYAEKYYILWIVIFCPKKRVNFMPVFRFCKSNKLWFLLLIILKCVITHFKHTQRFVERSRCAIYYYKYTAACLLALQKIFF